MITNFSQKSRLGLGVTCSLSRHTLLMSRCIAASKSQPVFSMEQSIMRYAARRVDGSVNLRSTSAGHRPVGGMPKRIFDILAASAAIALLSPLFAMLALTIKLSDHGPVLYAHRRVG